MKESVPPAVAAKTSATGSGGAASRGGLLAQVRAAGRTSPVLRAARGGAVPLLLRCAQRAGSSSVIYTNNGANTKVVHCGQIQKLPTRRVSYAEI